MGSSAKKKKEKKKDFQKTKLKVGKTKPKPANFTDTSFKAKSIVLKKQNLSLEAPTISAQVSHHIALLSNRAENIRHDSLAYLTNLSVQELDDAHAVILPQLPSLITDLAPAVRTQLLKLLQKFPVSRLAAQPEQLLAWTRAGMTHLAAEVRLFSLDVLEYMVKIMPHEVVSGVGTWYMVLEAFMTGLGWKGAVERTGWSMYVSSNNARLGAEHKSKAKQMNTLASFLRAGLLEDKNSQDSDHDALCFPLAQYQHHQIPRRGGAYNYLNLFDAVVDEEQQAFENREDRHRLFCERYEPSVRKGVEQMRKEGGELGRGAAAVLKVVDAAAALENG